MPRGGARVGSGRKGVKPGSSECSVGVDAGLNVGQAAVDPFPAVDETPLAYMLRVINDPYAPADRRDRLAVAAAPYIHNKVGDSGKKEQRKAAAGAAGKGKFAPADAPKLVVNNR